MDVEHGYYLIKFQTNDDFDKVLTQGSCSVWIILNRLAMDTEF